MGGGGRRGTLKSPERERDRGSDTERELVTESEREGERERGRASVCVCMCMCVRERERERKIVELLSRVRKGSDAGDTPLGRFTRPCRARRGRVERFKDFNRKPGPDCRVCQIHLRVKGRGILDAPPGRGRSWVRR